MKFPRHITKVGFLKAEIPVKECGEPKSEGMSPSQVVLEGESTAQRERGRSSAHRAVGRKNACEV